jgi:hypothetical protein
VDEKTSLRKQPATRPAAQSPAPPAADADVRASDADRDRVAEILREALAEGRLDADEHAERIDAVYRARTIGALRPLVRDLPAGHREAVRAAAPAAPHSARAAAGDNLVAVFSGASRRGRWRVGARINAFALFGGVEIDLTEALFERRELVVNATAIFGGVEIRVPENVTLRGSGTGASGHRAPADGPPPVRPSPCPDRTGGVRRAHARCRARAVTPCAARPGASSATAAAG